MIAALTIAQEIGDRLGSSAVLQETHDQIPTFWVAKDRVRALLRFLKEEVDRPYKMLYDLSAIDERMRVHREGQPASDFTVVYHLFSFDRNEYLRIKVALAEDRLSVPSITDIWPAANWYEREVWDMFGIVFDGHPHLQRILMPKTWVAIRCAKNIRHVPPRWGRTIAARQRAGRAGGAALPPGGMGHAPRARRLGFHFPDLGPQHPGTHGVLRVAVQLDGEEIVDAIPEIGFHHRGAEKWASASPGTRTSPTPIASTT